jgi:hypothetical protein
MALGVIAWVVVHCEGEPGLTEMEKERWQMEISREMILKGRMEREKELCRQREIMREMRLKSSF